MIRKPEQMYNLARRRWRTVCYEWSFTERRLRPQGGPWHDTLDTALGWAQWLYACGYRVHIESDGCPSRELHEFIPGKPTYVYTS